MDDLITDNYPVIPLYYDQAIRFVQNDVKGLKNESTQFIVLKKCTKTVLVSTPLCRLFKHVF